MSKVFVGDMDRDQWLELRRKSIGATDSAAILGMNPWKTAVEVYSEKLSGYDDPEDNAILRMELGLAMEPVLADLYTKETGRVLRQSNHINYHPEYSYISCNLDRVVRGEKRIVELKTGAILNDEDAIERRRLTYWVQVQHQMAVMGYDKADVFGLYYGMSNQKTDLLEVERDDNFIDKELIPGLVNFWENHIQKRIPPPAQKREDIDALYPERDPDKSVEFDNSIIQSRARYHEITAQVEALKTEKDQIKLSIMNKMEDAKQAVHNGEVIASCSIVSVPEKTVSGYTFTRFTMRKEK
jgi:putative phage-type endonuclease